MPEFETLSPGLAARLREDRAAGRMSPYACGAVDAVRRAPLPDGGDSAWRSSFVRDTETVMHCPFYNRYADKTQVFSFYKNDDITRRGLHVQLVSRISRVIGGALGLNTDLIEAIALGHDIGHTPFGHAGEKVLDELYYYHAGKHFAHNIQSVRVLDRIFPYGLSLQVLNGIAAHNGEIEQSRYRPAPLAGFDEFDSQIEACYRDPSKILKLVPCTLEGCVVRVSDIIAYLGKDRQDAERAGTLPPGTFETGLIGSDNSEIINNLIVNIIENSYGRPYIAMDDVHFAAMSRAKEENYRLIYGNPEVRSRIDSKIVPLMSVIYEHIVGALRAHDRSSPVYTHHINYVNMAGLGRGRPYGEESPDDIAVDYIASMTDDYFVDFYNHLCPGRTADINYIGYFDA
jgi:dGTPase